MSKRSKLSLIRHTWVIDLYRKYSKWKELARQAVTRFANAFPTMHNSTTKNAFRAMFISQEWTISNQASKNEGKQVVNIILCDDRF